MTSEARFPLKVEWEQIRESGLPGAELRPDPPLAAFPLRMEWDMLHPAAEEPFPAPLRASTDSGGTPEYPGGVVGLQRDAQRAGWSTELTYAVGYMPHSTHGRPGTAPKPSWALRMARGDERAVAVHRDGSWDSLWRWSSQRFFERFATLAAFVDAVTGVLVSLPSSAEWEKMLMKRPLKPTKAQRAEMERLLEEWRLWRGWK